MNYYLYITDNCHECELAMSYAQEHDLAVELVSKDKKDRPHETFVFPALFCDDKLISYGFEAMVNHFSKSISHSE